MKDYLNKSGRQRGSVGSLSARQRNKILSRQLRSSFIFLKQVPRQVDESNLVVTAKQVPGFVLSAVERIRRDSASAAGAALVADDGTAALLEAAVYEYRQQGMVGPLQLSTDSCDFQGRKGEEDGESEGSELTETIFVVDSSSTSTCLDVGHVEPQPRMPAVVGGEQQDPCQFGRALLVQAVTESRSALRGCSVEGGDLEKIKLARNHYQTICSEMKQTSSFVEGEYEEALFFRLLTSALLLRSDAERHASSDNYVELLGDPGFGIIRTKNFKVTIDSFQYAQLAGVRDFLTGYLTFELEMPRAVRRQAKQTLAGILEPIFRLGAAKVTGWQVKIQERCEQLIQGDGLDPRVAQLIRVLELLLLQYIVDIFKIEDPMRILGSEVQAVIELLFQKIKTVAALQSVLRLEALAPGAASVKGACAHVFLRAIKSGEAAAADPAELPVS